MNIRLRKRFSVGLIACINAILFIMAWRYSQNSVYVQKTHIDDNKADFHQRIIERQEIIERISNYSENHMEEEKKRVPDVIGIGVKKCGTDGLIRFLNHHPLIKIPDQADAETFFFTNYYDKGIQHYLKLLPAVNKQEKVMEKTPVYFDFPPSNLPELIKFHSPEVKIILMLCDPTERAFSEYVHQMVRLDIYGDRTMDGFPTFKSFVDAYLPKLQGMIEKYITTSQTIWSIQEKLSQMAKGDKTSALITTGLYTYHLKRWMRVFNETNLMIISGEEFKDDPGSVLEKVQDFIQIPKLLWKEDFVRNPQTGFFCYRRFTESYLNKSVLLSDDELIETLSCLIKTKGRTRNGAKTPQEMSMKKLRDFYKPFNEELYHDVNRNFNWM